MRAVIKILFLQDKVPKEIHAILTETLACFLPGRAKDLSAPLYNNTVGIQLIAVADPTVTWLHFQQILRCFRQHPADVCSSFYIS